MCKTRRSVVYVSSPELSYCFHLQVAESFISSNNTSVMRGNLFLKGGGCLKLQTQPLAIRIFHWVMTACVIVLVITGLLFYAEPGQVNAPFRMIRLLHGTAGVILTLNVLAHIYYYLVTRRYPEIVLNRSDISNLKAFFQYYLFLRPAHPNFGRYNPGQKLIFDSWAIVSVLSAIAGFILLFPSETGMLQRWSGGLQMLRLLKYGITVWFLLTIPVHIYLVFTEDPAKLQAMFTGYVRKENNQQVNAAKLPDNP